MKVVMEFERFERKIGLEKMKWLKSEWGSGKKWLKTCGPHSNVFKIKNKSELRTATRPVLAHTAGRVFTSGKCIGF